MDSKCGTGCKSFECKYEKLHNKNSGYQCIMQKGDPCENKQCYGFEWCVYCIKENTSRCPKEG